MLKPYSLSPYTSVWMHLIWIVVVSTMLLACPARHSNVGAGGPDGVEEPLPAEAQAALDEAVAAMAAENFDDAQSTLDLVAARYPDTQAAARAQLLQIVIALRAGRSANAIEQLSTLAADTDETLSVRQAAAGYYALDRMRSGASAEALDILAELYPGNAPPPLVGPSDRQPLLILLAETRRRDNDVAATFEALSWLYQLGDQQGRQFARTRGLELARTVARDDPSRLEPFAASPDDFIRGYTGAGRLLVALESSTALEDKSKQAQMSELLQSIAPTLLRLTDTELTAELTARLSASDGPEPLRIGALLPLSGPDRRVGERALAGLLIAQGAFRTQQGGQGLTLVLHDTASAPLKAAEGVQLLADQGVSLVIGPLANEEAAAAATQAESAGIPLISLNLDATVADTGPNSFRLFLDNRQEVETLLAHAAKHNATRIAVLFPDLPLGRELASHAQKLSANAGVSIVESISYAPSNTDFSRIARRVRAAKVDAVFIPDVGDRVSLIMPYLASEQLWCAAPGAEDSEERKPLICLGNVTWLDGDLLKRTSPYVQGSLIAASYTQLAQTPENQTFVRLHNAWVGRAPDLFAAYAYSAMKLARTVVLERGASDRKAVRAALAGLRNARGLNGTLRNSGNGTLRSAPTLLMVQGQKFVRVSSGGAQ